MKRVESTTSTISRQLASEVDEQLLRHDLKRSVMLGSLYNEPVIIHYLDKWGRRQKVEDVVLSATERYVTLKGGTFIPIDNVRRVI